MLDLGSYSEENPYSSLERVFLERRARHARRMGAGLSAALLLLWVATLVLIKVRPDLLGLMPIAICR